ncbi:hypothetical protein ONZ45_g7865 [Pleurotus djamor]|nr:hypothetical protein ONZ45_g7865 [Pleurotus djamor]
MSELLQRIQQITTLHRPTPSHWGKSLNISFDSGYPVIAVDTAFIGRKEAKILVRQEYNAALSDLAGSRLNVDHVFGPPPTFNTDIDDAIFVEREAPFTLSDDHVAALNGRMNFDGFIITGSPGIKY